MKVLVLVPPGKEHKNVVRDFMYGCWCKGRRIGGMQMPPLNLLYIASTLKEAGHEVGFVDASVDPSSYKTIENNGFPFDIVILLSSTNSFKMDIKIIKEIKQARREIKSILFGSHPTFMPGYCLNEDTVDIIVRGEPEFIIRDLLNELKNGSDQWKKVKGIGYRENGNNCLNAAYPLIDNLDELPMPDRTFLPAGIDYFNPVIKRMPYTTMQTSRGCPAKCNFCTVPFFFGNKFRFKSVEKVMEEFRHIISLGYREVFIRDETFTAYKKRNIEICRRMIDEKMDLTWIANARADMIDKETMEIMKKAGCHMIKFGVESGVQEILDNIKKGIRVEDTRNALKWCRETGIDAHGHVMLGCPGESKETIEQTIKFVREINPYTASFGIHTPYPGTELFNKVAALHPEIADGSDADLAKLHITGFFNESFTNLRKEDLEKSVVRAYRKFYLRPGHLLKILGKTRSFDELMRLAVAGSNIFTFTVRGNN
ncbi:MAG: B12-binding domain-containing radical SAM protein [Spirochaetes bacterium GWF1_41_5]|nr:MAG: B12-binding domain-containing radical SAM protein [Spirochaetes bacterium GWF1_41_5]HBE03323.1 B12-binding domain-containing radical SAM protein [Spirochaetia bacterium]